MTDYHRVEHRDDNEGERRKTLTARLEAMSNPILIRWGRDQGGYTLEDAARKIGVSPDKLRSWESGDASPSITQLRKLADVYKRPLSVFFLNHEPPDEPLPVDYRRLEVHAALGVSPALRLAIRIARHRREAAIDLLEELGETTPAFAVAGRLREDPEHLAQRLRTHLGVPASPVAIGAREAFNEWRDLAEAGGALVFQAQRIAIQEMRALSHSEHPLPFVLLNIRDAPAARLFSLLHELAHISLGRGGLCTLDENGGQTDHARLEAFCNRVAGAALMPREALMAVPGIPERRASAVADEVLGAVAGRFGVSREAALLRLVSLDLVAREFYLRRRTGFLQEYERLAAAKRNGFAHPGTLAVASAGPRLSRLVLEAWSDQRITSSAASDILDVRVKHFDRIQKSLQSRAFEAEDAE